MEIRVRSDRYTILVDELAETGRQIFFARHLCAAYQEGDDRYATFQGRLDFYPDKVGGIIQSSFPRLVPRLEPVIAEDRQKNAALPDLLVQVFLEINSQGDRIDIFKNRIPSKLIDE